MATITNPQLAIATDRDRNKATVTVTCDVEFTAFEVNAMNRLGVRHSLDCHLLNIEMLYPGDVAVFTRQQFPRVLDEARAHEHAVLETVSTMTGLHLYIFGKDALVAELRLTNDDLGTVTVWRMPAMLVDLAA